MGLSQGFAFAGIVKEVVVCVPLTHFQIIVSPTLQLTVLGENWKLETLTVIFFAKLEDDMAIKASIKKRVIFFIAYGLCGFIIKRNKKGLILIHQISVAVKSWFCFAFLS